MTAEQLEFFSEQTRLAVRKYLRRYRAAALVGFMILLVGLAVALSQIGRSSDASRRTVVESGRAVAVEGCNRDYVDRRDFRALLGRLKASSKTSYESGRITRAQYEVAVSFYDGQLKRFKLPDCRLSEKLLTDNPDAKIPMITPFYEGSPFVPEPVDG